MTDEEKLAAISDALNTHKWGWDLCAKIADVLDDAESSKDPK